MKWCCWNFAGVKSLIRTILSLPQLGHIVLEQILSSQIPIHYSLWLFGRNRCALEISNSALCCVTISLCPKFWQERYASQLKRYLPRFLKGVKKASVVAPVLALPDLSKHSELILVWFRMWRWCCATAARGAHCWSSKEASAATRNSFVIKHKLLANTKALGVFWCYLLSQVSIQFWSWQTMENQKISLAVSVWSF